MATKSDYSNRCMHYSASGTSILTVHTEQWWQQRFYFASLYKVSDRFCLVYDIYMVSSVGARHFTETCVKFSYKLIFFLLCSLEVVFLSNELFCSHKYFPPYSLNSMN